MENQVSLESQKLVQKILYFALCMSLIIHGYIGFAFIRPPEGSLPNGWPSSELFHPANFPLYLASIMAAVSLTFHKWVHNPERLVKKKSELMNKELNLNNGRMSAQQQAFIKSLPKEEQIEFALFTEQLTFNIINWAFNESIGIFGIVAIVLGMPSANIFYFVSAALVLNFIMYPKNKS